MRLKRKFFEQPTIKVSKQLLGKFLVRVEDLPAGKAGQESKRVKVGKIVETEAYIGPDDKASHASFGKTKRCLPMYDKPGTAYVYFIYGMYWMLNIVTEEEEKPCAVLIRALEPVSALVAHRNFGSASVSLAKKRLPLSETHRRSQSEASQNLVGSPRSLRIASGPGKLCQWMKIDGSFNGEDLVTSSRLWVESQCLQKNSVPSVIKIVAAKRIGVDYAGKWKDMPWRFYLKDNPYVSKR